MYSCATDSDRHGIPPSGMPSHCRDAGPDIAWLRRPDTGSTWHWRAWCLLLLCCLLPLAAAASDSALEYKVKAAYLYKFSSYIEWPESAFASPDAPLVIGVLGADAVAHELESLLANRSSQQHPLLLKRLQPGADLAGVHILFIGKSEAGNLKTLLQPMQARPVLVVTESANALTAGSIINFVLQDQRVRFEIALGKAEHSGLKLSARLLAVATQVRNGAP